MLSPVSTAATAVAALALATLGVVGTAATATAATPPTHHATTTVRDLVLHDPAETGATTYFGNFWVGDHAAEPQTLFGAHSTATEYAFPTSGTTGQIVDESPYGDLCLTTGVVNGVVVVGERVCSSDPQQRWDVTADGHLANAASGQQVGFVDVPDQTDEGMASHSHRRLGMVSSSNLVLAGD